MAIKNKLLLATVVTGLLQVSTVSALSFEDLSGLLTAQTCGAAVDLLKADLTPVPLYRSEAGECVSKAMKATSEPGVYYTDNGCLHDIVYQASSTAEHCNEILQPDLYGNDPSVDDDGGSWRLSPWTALDVGVIPLKGNAQPYESRSIYKATSGINGGQCTLEMRIFSRNPGVFNQKPLLMIHGGSWKYRQAGTLGLHSQISHYTEKGFVVFSPFYRLTSSVGQGESFADVEGGEYCSGASGQDILDDADDALEWVLQYGDLYNAAEGPVTVGGQSAGAHLATYLAVNHPDQIESALLLYPPSDFADFITQARLAPAGEPNEGQSALEGFVGESLSDVSVNNALVTANSFPTKIALSPETIPPFYILHGAADTLVPVRQSVRLCNAFAGNADSGVADQITTDVSQAVIQSFDCGEKSRLQVITEADHVLDFCAFDPRFAFFASDTNLCPTGGKASIAAARSALVEGIDWLKESKNETSLSADSGEREDPAGTAGDNAVESEQASRSSGGGAFGIALFALFAGFGLRRKLA